MDLILTFCIGLAIIFTSLMISKIIVAYFLNIIDDHLKKCDESIMDLITWAKDEYKHQ